MENAPVSQHDDVSRGRKRPSYDSTKSHISVTSHVQIFISVVCFFFVKMEKVK